MTTKSRSETPNAETTDPTDPSAQTASNGGGVQPHTLAQMVKDNAVPFDPTAFDIDRLLDSEIPGWKPEPGDKLVGTVVNLETGGEGSTFGSYPLLTIALDGSGELLMVHAFHSVLRRELSRKSVGMGDRLGIKYIGVREGGEFGKFESYRVVVQARSTDRLTAAQGER